MMLKKFRVTDAHETRSGFATGNAAEISRFFVRAGEMLENGVVVSPIEIVGQRDGIILTRSGRFVQTP